MLNQKECFINLKLKVSCCLRLKEFEEMELKKASLPLFKKKLGSQITINNMVQIYIKI